MQGLDKKSSPATTTAKNKYNSRIGKLQDLIYQGLPDEDPHINTPTPLVGPQSDSDSDGGTVLYNER